VTCLSRQKINKLVKEYKLRIVKIIIIPALFIVLLSIGCASKKIQLPDYSEFAALRQKAVPVSVQEIYGRLTANASGKSARSSFNLLLEPGKNAYLEILDPSSQLIYAFSLNSQTITLLWAKDANYMEEPADAKSVEEITGFPILPEDLLLLMGGYGLDFSQWEVRQARKDGWDLVRGDFVAQLFLKEMVSKVTIATKSGSRLVVRYEDYRMMNDRLIPSKILFELPQSKISVDLSIEKYLPRNEPASADLFTIQLPKGAHLLSLSDIYDGKPLLFAH
jgi:outer membrane biogenesis lipoprotein LolB